MAGTDIEPRPDALPVHVPGMPQRKRESEAAVPRAFRAARRNRHLTVPLTVPPAAWTFAAAAHAYGAGPEVAAAGAVGAVAVWLFAPHKWLGKDGGPRMPEVWYARMTAVAFPAWLTAASFLGPASGSGAELAGALAVLSAAWGVPWYRHYRVRDRKRRADFLRDCRAFWDGHRGFGATGSNVIRAEEKPAQTWLRIQLIGGQQSIDTLRGSVHLIESAARVGRRMVRVEEVEGDASLADVFIKHANPLKGVIGWDPSLAPRSVHDDAVIGMSETGELVRVPQRTNAFVNGKTRSGKSNHLLLRVAQLSGCPDDRQIVIDLKKRNARPLLKTGAVDWVITDLNEARACLRMLCAELAARSRDWDTGEEQALADERTPAIHALVDETSPLTSAIAGDAECARLMSILASQGSGLEEYVEVCTQYGGLEESVRTEQTRMNLPLRICYAVEHADHGAFALGDVRGDASKLEEKGEFLMKLGPKSKAAKLRAPHMPHSLFERVAAENARSVRKLRMILFCGGEPSGIGNLTWQEWYDQRHLRIEPAFRGISPQYAAAVGVHGEPAETETPSVSAAAGPGPKLRAVPPLPPGDEEDEDGATVAARIAAETGGDDIAPTASAAASAAGSSARKRELFCAALAPGSPMSPDALVEASGQARSTVMDNLKRLLERGAVTRPEKGVYVAVPGRSISAEMKAIKDGDDALAVMADSAS